MKRLAIAGLLLSVAVLTLSELSAADEAAAPSKTWKLGTTGNVSAMSFTVSPDGRYAVLDVSRFTPNMPPERKTLLFDTQAGKSVDVAELLGKSSDANGVAPKHTGFVHFSPNGKYLAVMAITFGDRGPRCSQWVIALADNKAKKLADADGFMIGTWVGNRVAVSSCDEDENSQPVKLIDPATGKTEELKLRMAIAAGSDDGKTIVAMYDPNDVTKSISVGDEDKLPMATMTLDGKILRRLGTGPEVGAPPIYSADGKFIAFQYNKWSKAGTRQPPEAVYTNVMSVRGDKTRSIKALLPVHVTDLNNAITLGGENFMDRRTLPVKLWDGDKSITLVPNALAAAVAGDKLYYVTGGPDEELVLHAAKIDDLKKSAGK